MNLAQDSKVQSIIASLTKTFEVKLPNGMSASPSYLHAVLIVFLLFLLVLMLGQLRHRMVNWEMKGIFPGVALGIGIAFAVEGLFLVGGRTILTELIGWKSAPKPIVNVLDAGRDKLTDVLGVTKEIPQSMASDVNNLSSEEIQELRALICK